MKSIEKNKRFLAILGAGLVLFGVGMGSMRQSVAYAESVTVADFDKTSVEEDLKNFDLEEYVKYLAGATNPSVINFQEYCFTEYGLYETYYGLYLYVCVPTGAAISPSGHYANIAVEYDDKGEPSRYENVPITLLDTWGGTGLNKIHKFKIQRKEDTAQKKYDFLDMAKSYADKHEGKRRYDIAGVQLRYDKSDADYVMDGTFGRTYTFEGYGKGMSDASVVESTLKSSYTQSRTLELEVNHTYWRNLEDLNLYQEEINSVYFSLPANYCKDNDFVNLTAIDAEWWEYKTKPIFVTSDTNAYDALLSRRGIDMSDYENMSDPDFKWRVLWEEEITSQNILVHGHMHTKGNHYFGHSYNGYADNQWNYLLKYCWDCAEPLARMDWLLKVEDKDFTLRENWKVSNDELVAYINEYTQAFSGSNSILEGTVSEETPNGVAKGLFIDTVDKGRKRGYNRKEITPDDEEFIITSTQTQSWWQKIWGDFSIETNIDSMSPIVVLDKSSFNGIDDHLDFAKKYYVNEEDALEVYNYCYSAVYDEEKSPVLFRFAVTDYYASAARFDKDGNLELSKIDGYVAQETMFFNFDIISLTFEDLDGEEHVVSVVSDPTTIINGLDPAPGIEDVPEEGLWDKLVRSVLEWWVSLTDGKNKFLTILKIIGGVLGAVAILWVISVVVNLFRSIFGKK